MRAFDLVRTDPESGLADRLGFEEILVFDESMRESSRVGMASDAGILQKVRSGGIGVISDDYSIDGKLMAEMKENGTALYLALGRITNTYGLRRSRGIYLARRAFRYARQRRIDVGFITFAETAGQMCSAIQMIELAKLIGADEDIARAGLEEVNSRLLRCRSVR